MALNMHMVAEVCSGAGHLAILENAPASHVLDLARWEILSPDVSPWCEDCLYVAAEFSAVPQLLLQDRNAHLLVVGSVEAEHRCQSIALPQATFRDAIACVQKLFSDDAALVSEIFRLLSAGSTLDKLLATSVRGTSSLVAVFDPYLILLASYCAPEQGSGFALWEETLQNGGAPMDGLPLAMRRQIEERLRSADMPVIIDTDDDQRLISSLKKDGMTFSAISVGRPFSPGEVALLMRARGLLARCLPLMQDFVSTRETPLLIAKALDGMPVDSRALELMLSNLGWSQDDAYQAICISFEGGERGNEGDAERYLPSLRHALPHAQVFAHGGWIVAVRQVADLHGAEMLPQAFNDAVARLELRVGVGMPYRGFTHIASSYVQASMALSGVPDTGFELFEDGYLTHLSTAVSSSTSLEAFCHPRMLDLWARGKEKDRELVRTLDAFLAHGRNFSTTARDLFVHRNTLIYRIERLSQILGFDLSDKDIDSGILLFLQVSCLLIPKMDV